MPSRLGDARSAGSNRLRLGLGDLDRVLGGGLAGGSLTLLAGAPGIGKSTLLLQAAAEVVARGERVLYASGEESAAQVRVRAERLGGASAEVLFLAEHGAERIVEAATVARPGLLCVDSIQTALCEETSSAAGSVSQVRESAAVFQAYAKRSGTPTVLVGHVTKGGGIAGPRTLEHLVDAVLVFEALQGEDARVLRARKNRFGRVGEMAVYRMASTGLEPIPDPARAALDRRGSGPGSTLTLSLEGARPVAVEVQALTTAS
ncbi:MAG: AAA family ATPase, partial [Gemmatimonadota bacterium]|nr:AAA family ATPase [Gemmatimonadota bacterium]